MIKHRHFRASKSGVRTGIDMEGIERCWKAYKKPAARLRADAQIGPIIECSLPSDFCSIHTERDVS
jgi:hypothetical protein